VDGRVKPGHDGYHAATTLMRVAGRDFGFLRMTISIEQLIRSPINLPPVADAATTTTSRNGGFSRQVLAQPLMRIQCALIRV
jgi:hypothetical protein